MKKLLQADTRTSNNKKTNGKHCYIPTKKTKKKRKKLANSEKQKKSSDAGTHIKLGWGECFRDKRDEILFTCPHKKDKKTERDYASKPRFYRLKKSFVLPKSETFRQLKTNALCDRVMGKHARIHNKGRFRQSKPSHEIL